MKRPEFIYFDLDDTLLDHKEAEKRALLETRKDFEDIQGVSAKALTQTYHEVNKELWHQYNHGNINKQELKYQRFAKTLDKLGLRDCEPDEIGVVYVNHYQKYWDWVAGAEAFFAEIIQHYEVGILTNGFIETQKKKLSQFRFNELARFNIISEEVGYMKPHPKIFEYATGLSGRRPEQILYVGDSYNSDVEGGAQFGWNTAWFTHSPLPEQSAADFIFNDFKQLHNLLL